MNEAHAHVESVKETTVLAEAAAETPALNFTAFEDTAVVSSGLGEGLDLNDPALDKLDVAGLLEIAFSKIRMEEGLTAERQGDDLLFDELDGFDTDPDLGMLEAEAGRDPELGALGSPKITPVAPEAGVDGEISAPSQETPVVEGVEATIPGTPPLPSDNQTADPGLDFDDDFRPESEVFTPVAGADSQISSAVDDEKLTAAAGEIPEQNEASLDGKRAHAELSLARDKNGAELVDGLQAVQSAGPAGNYPDQQIRVGLIQGLSMLGGAGLAGLAKMIHSGGSTINNQLRQRQYGKLSTQIDQITQNMDSLMGKMNANGLAAGLDGLKGDQRSEFVKEFFENPTNKGMFNELLGSVGNLATKATEAAVVGAAAGLSPDQIDTEITRRITDVQQKHKSLLETMTDHNGVSLSDRLTNIAQQLAAAIDKLFQRASQALGLSPRPGM
ncbi:hypothetical protein [Pseudomonas sp. UMAB-40]|uniref:hypothetical protein n=1 Tax=Pseudomonas sp. UMAB-40 TaxID=1365407 RepID=UPI001C59FC72|nr:hypothetical protein [Pseudomonas sp. UMAB-40]